MDDMETLRTLVAAQREQIRELNVMVTTLIKMLHDAGTLDEKVLRYRVEAELEAADEA